MNPILVPFFASAASGSVDPTTIICWIAALGLICWLLWWLIGYLNIPEPANKVARAVVAVVGVVVLIKIVIRVFGNPF